MDWKNLVSTVAPWIGTALGGPLGGLAVSALGDAFGISDATEAKIKNALSGASPEHLLAMKEADQQFALKMQELGFANIKDLEAIAAADRDSARKMQIASPSFMPAVLSGVVTVGFLGILIGMMAGWLKTESSDALLLMLGALGTAWTGVMAFWFGTTRQSEQKTSMLAQSSPAK